MSDTGQDDHGDEQQRAARQLCDPPPTAATWLGVMAGVLGLLGILTYGATAIVGLVVGLVALRRARTARARTWATIGSAASAVGILAWPILATREALFASWDASIRQNACTRRLGVLGRGMIAYRADFDDEWPPASMWCDSLLATHVRNPASLHCLGWSGRGGYVYGLSPPDSIPQAGDPPGNVPVAFDGRGDWNVAGGRGLVDMRHRGNFNALFADGHVARYTEEQLDGLAWAVEDDGRQ